MKKLLTYGIYSTFIYAALFLIACGGGSSGEGGFVGAGRVELTASPTSIDVGDRMEVKVRLQDVSEDGVIVKIKYADGLEYVLNSASLEVDSNDLDVGPAVNMLKNKEVFLVFYFGQDLFDDTATGTLTFQLEGTDRVSNGEIEVDLDVDDPLIANTEEFDIENPEFQVEDAVGVNVEE